jgi:hypothetical protein
VFTIEIILTDRWHQLVIERATYCLPHLPAAMETGRLLLDTVRHERPEISPDRIRIKDQLTDAVLVFKDTLT